MQQHTDAVEFQFWGRVSYDDALERMNAAQQARRAGEIADTVFYLEHPPVITHGRATPAEHLHRREHGIPIVEIPRGGMATYHGPGQLVGYAIVNLSERRGGNGPDVGGFLRALESGIIAYLVENWRIRSCARPGFTGVWVSDRPGMRKIASIGVSVRRGVTAHGFALNLSTDLSAFSVIVPCGNEHDAMTSVQHEMELAGDTPYLCVTESLARDAHTHVSNALANAGWGKP